MRLVHDDVLAALHGGNADDAVEMVGRHDLDGVDVLFLVEQLAEIGISGASADALAGTLGTIVGVDDVFGAIPAAGDGGVGAGFPVGLVERAANVVSQPGGGPVAVASASLLGSHTATI